ncbi:MAG TPA: dTDP-4-dehydrorhamnose 3,5-epimerase family protein [Planctomycetota bacterium]|jgi:dTDP-4-dehydrorhamnose 3,5-epimerase|nr:dTDP-4-dehydrorhamnose 3,5-epimerase family protein [Planctomycetota bacterium]
MSQFNASAEAAYSVQDYGGSPSIEGVELIPLRRFNDDGGSMTELARLDGGAHEAVEGFDARQMNYSVLEPQAIKAFHLHRRQTDVWFVPPSDKIMLVLADVRAGSASEGVVQRIMLGDGNSRLVRIPPGVAHGCRNLRPHAPGAIIYFVDVQFAVGEDCDEGRLPWDHFGEQVWEVERA